VSLALRLLLSMGWLAAFEPPLVRHQPVPCTVALRPFTLCANVTDDGQVSKVKLYFRPVGETFYSYVDMTFDGIRFCGTLPAPLKTRSLEYYVEGVDDTFDPARTSTYVIRVEPEGVCDFAPVEKDPSRTASITVYATNKKQGKNPPSLFDRSGVSFVPVAR
jgi:hypothetical protein